MSNVSYLYKYDLQQRIIFTELLFFSVKDHKSQCDYNCQVQQRHGKMKKIMDDADPSHIYECHLGIVAPDLGMPIPPGVPANISLMHKALMRYEEITKNLTPNEKAWKRYYEGEADYKPYYNDLVENERDWMEVRYITFSYLSTYQILCTSSDWVYTVLWT